MGMFEDLKRYKLSLILIGLLVFVRFVVYPLYDWQLEQYNTNSMLKNKLERVESLLVAQAEHEAKVKEIQNNISQADSMFLVAKDVASFQLERQQWLEASLVEFELRASNVGWSPKQEISELSLSKFSVQVNLLGTTEQLIRFMTFLHEQPFYVEVSDFNVSFIRQSKTSLGSSRVRVNLAFYAKEVAA